MQEIVKLLNTCTRDEPSRNYIGASGIGHPCFRKIWYEFKKPDHAKAIDAHTLRILELGHLVENMLLKHLASKGVIFIRSEESIFLSDKRYPFFGGHVDAILPDENMILEIKTAKDSSFKIFKRKGIHGWYPAYYAQVQSYMGFTGCTRACVLAFNKDNADLHSEIINFDEDYYHKLQQKALAIYNSDVEPPRLSENPTWFQCKMCDFRDYCHGL